MLYYGDVWHRFGGVDVLAIIRDVFGPILLEDISDNKRHTHHLSASMAGAFVLSPLHRVRFVG